MYMFRPIQLKQFNSFTTVNARSSLCVLGVTHQIAVPELPRSNTNSDKDFRICFFALLLSIHVFGPKSLFCHEFLHFFCNIISFSILNILKNVWPNIRVSRYRHRIFKSIYLYIKLNTICFYLNSSLFKI